MLFPQHFHGRTLWSGYLLSQGISLHFTAEYVSRVEFRSLKASFCCGQKIMAQMEKPAFVNIEELGAFDSSDRWGMESLNIQLKRIMSRIRRFRLVECGQHGLTLHAYFGDQDPADLIWNYLPKLGGPDRQSLLSDRLIVEPCELAEIFPVNPVVRLAA